MQIGRLWVRGTQIMGFINLLLPRQLESGFGWAWYAWSVMEKLIEQIQCSL